MDNKSALTKEDIYVIGIHILFGIVIGVVFTDFNEELFPFTFTFKSAMIVTALATILLSWIGYNSRVQLTGHNSPVLFVIDVIIVYLYFQLVYSVNDSLSQYVLSLFFIFIAYLIWDVIKGYYDKENIFSRKGNKLWKTVIVIISICIFFGIYMNIENGNLNNLQPGEEKSQTSDLVVIVILTIILFAFRQFEPPFEQIWSKIKNH